MQQSQFHNKSQGNASGTDWCSKGNAELLAQRIRDYWAKMGKSPEVWITKGYTERGCSLITNSEQTFCIRSNMANGAPL